MKHTPLNAMKTFFCSLLLSFVFVVLGLHIVPRGFAFEASNFTAISTALGIFLLLLIPICITMLVCTLRNSSQNSSFVSVLGGSGALVLLFFVGTILVASIYGLLAMLLHTILGASAKIDAVRHIVSVVIEIVTVLLMPVYVAALFGFAYREERFWGGIKFGLKQLKRSYVKLLGVMVLEVFLGYGIVWLFRPGSVFFGTADIFKAIFLSILGAVGLFTCAKISAPHKHPEEKFHR